MSLRTLPPIPSAVRRCERLTYESGKDWIYAYYDRDGELLYVGVSNYPPNRANSHRAVSKWWRFVAAGEVVLLDLAKSGRIEQEAIECLDPVFNIEHSLGSSRDVVEYCARREAWDLVDYYLDAFGLDDPEAA